ncbi:putative amidoligase domain-containing protein [Gorillibacterium sp. sgz5001074]|uniref:putative amidoligase domain-containing protein n=1 Tax=Gorillibacterium sp. sgz5001074 TaxID=3446695 RepID=UPI003F676926
MGVYVLLGRGSRTGLLPLFLKVPCGESAAGAGKDDAVLQWGIPARDPEEAYVLNPVKNLLRAKHAKSVREIWRLNGLRTEAEGELIQEYRIPVFQQEALGVWAKNRPPALVMPRAGGWSAGMSVVSAELGRDESRAGRGRSQGNKRPLDSGRRTTSGTAASRTVSGPASDARYDELDAEQQTAYHVRRAKRDAVRAVYSLGLSTALVRVGVDQKGGTVLLEADSAPALDDRLAELFAEAINRYAEERLAADRQEGAITKKPSGTRPAPVKQGASDAGDVLDGPVPEGTIRRRPQADPAPHPSAGAATKPVPEGTLRVKRPTSDAAMEADDNGSAHGSGWPEGDPAARRPVLLGADPEFVLRRPDGHFVSASRYLEKEGAVGCDAVVLSRSKVIHPLAELRPKPCASPPELVRELYRTMRQAAALIGDDSLAWLAGSMPAKGLPIGGHVHVSGVWLNERLLRALDNYVALPLVLAEGQAAGRRRPRYGFLGDCRRKRHGGFEYRSLPSWLSTPQLALAVFALVRAVALHYRELPARPLDAADVQRAYYSSDKAELLPVVRSLWPDLERLPAYREYRGPLDALRDRLFRLEGWDEQADFRIPWKIPPFHGGEAMSLPFVL